MELSSGLSLSELYSEEIYDEYEDRIYATVQDGTTYPLFDKTGNIVEEAIRRKLILPSQGAVARGRHGGLSGDLLQRLPLLFERASVAEVLNIREELAVHLDVFREAVAQFAATISPASWDEEFTEEAERILRERVDPAVRRIERAVEEKQDLRELIWRFSPPMAAGAFPRVGVFVGSGSVLGSLAVLALGVTAGAAQGAARHREQRQALEGNQLYFYYRTGELLRRARR